VKLSSNPGVVASDLKKRFREYWTVEYDNYPVPEGYLKASSPVSVKAEV
jgi:formylmethanofuran dehydrogenase subunit A